VPFLAEKIPEGNRGFAPRLTHPGKIAFYVRHEQRHSDGTEALRHHLQRDGFTGACRSGNQTVAIGHLG
jgi:hypothetical protein